MDAKAVAETRKKEILEILADLKQKNQLDDIFISFIDLGAGFNLFVADSVAMQSVLGDVLGIRFGNNLAIRPGFIMRKEIAPLLKVKLS